MSSKRCAQDACVKWAMVASRFCRDHNPTSLPAAPPTPTNRPATAPSTPRGAATPTNASAGSTTTSAASGSGVAVKVPSLTRPLSIIGNVATPITSAPAAATAAATTSANVTVNTATTPRAIGTTTPASATAGNNAPSTPRYNLTSPLSSSSSSSLSTGTGTSSTTPSSINVASTPRSVTPNTTSPAATPAKVVPVKVSPASTTPSVEIKRAAVTVPVATVAKVVTTPSTPSSTSTTSSTITNTTPRPTPNTPAKTVASTPSSSGAKQETKRAFEPSSIASPTSATATAAAKKPEPPKRDAPKIGARQLPLSAATNGGSLTPTSAAAGSAPLGTAPIAPPPKKILVTESAKAAARATQAGPGKQAPPPPPPPPPPKVAAIVTPQVPSTPVAVQKMEIKVTPVVPPPLPPPSSTPPTATSAAKVETKITITPAVPAIPSTPSSAATATTTAASSSSSSGNNAAGVSAAAAKFGGAMWGKAAPERRAPTLLTPGVEKKAPGKVIEAAKNLASSAHLKMEASIGRQRGETAVPQGPNPYGFPSNTPGTGKISVVSRPPEVKYGGGPSLATSRPSTALTGRAAHDAMEQRIRKETLLRRGTALRKPGESKGPEKRPPPPPPKPSIGSSIPSAHTTLAAPTRQLPPSLPPATVNSVDTPSSKPEPKKPPPLPDYNTNNNSTTKTPPPLPTVPTQQPVAVIAEPIKLATAPVPSPTGGDAKNQKPPPPPPRPSRQFQLDDFKRAASASVSGGNDAVENPIGLVTTLRSESLDEGNWKIRALCADKNGFIYVADSDAHCIYKLSPNGAQSVHAGRVGESGYADGNGNNARFAGICALAIDQNGNIYAADEENHRIRKITSDGMVTTLTGSGDAGFADGARDKASFQEPKGIAVDNDGQWVYVADTYNNRIRKISAGSGMTGTLAGNGDDARVDGIGKQASFDGPQSLTVDSQGNVYVSDTLNRCIRKISTSGAVTTIAGSDYVGAQDGPAAMASFAYPLGIAMDPKGHLYIADVDNDRIRKLSLPDGIVTTLIGETVSTNSGGDNVDGPIQDATLIRPEAICFDTAGNLYFSDDGVSIRKIALATQVANRVTNTVSTLGEGDTHVPSGVRGLLATHDGWLYIADTANSRVRKAFVVGYDRSDEVWAGGNKNDPPLIGPSGMTQGTNGEIYIADATSHSIRVILPSGVVKTFAGTDEAGYHDAPAAAAEFTEPRHIVFDARDGSLYVSDTGNNRIRKITAHGNVTTLAGGADAKVPLRDGRGAAAAFNRPGGIGLDLQGNLWVADTHNNAIRRITLATGEVITIAGGNADGKLADGQGRGASFSRPTDLVVDGNGDVFVSDRDNNAVRRVTSAGTVTTVAGLPSDAGSRDGDAVDASFDHPQSIALDAAGNLYVSHQSAHRIRKIANVTTSGSVAAILLQRKLRLRNKRLGDAESDSDSDSDDETRGLAENKRMISSVQAGDVITVAGDGTVGEKDAMTVRASFNHPRGMAMDRWGYLFVADQENNRIRKISPTGDVITFAGTGLMQCVDGTTAYASFEYPTSICFDKPGNLYICETMGCRLRKITPSGDVTTIAGENLGFLDGNGSDVQFHYPNGLAIDSNGVFYIADTGNHRIRRVMVNGDTTTLIGGNEKTCIDGPAASARLVEPRALACDAANNLLILDGNRVRKYTAATGMVSTLAGGDAAEFADGKANDARFHTPNGLVADGIGNVYVCDTNNHRIRKISPDGMVRTLAGTYMSEYLDGPSVEAGFRRPSGIMFDGQGNLFVADDDDHRIRKIIKPAAVVL